MGLRVIIDTENAAFDDGAVCTECARILEEIAEKVRDWDGDDRWKLIHDVNGNRVGQWRLDGQEE